MTGLYLVKCFNTSHVKVNPEDKYGIKCPYTSFNTSHVKVNPNINQDLERLNDSFNTSHVKVNRKSLSASSGSVLRVSIHPMLKLIPTFWHYSGRRMGVSIHPMLKLIIFRMYLKPVQSCFNTSHVKVNPTYFLHSIQYTIPDSPVFINVFKIFTSHRAICQKNLENHRNATVFADSRNFALIGG